MQKQIKMAILAVLTLIFSLACSSDPVEGDGGGNGNGNGNGNVSELFPKGKVTCNGAGVADVVVTDGKYFTKTGMDGSFQLSYNDKATHVYISTPAGYTVRVVNSVPVYWTKLDGADSGNLNFELIATGNDEKHYFIGVGDPQIRNDAEGTKLQQKLAALKTEIDGLGTDLPVHVMVAGDIVFNTMNMHARSKTEFTKLEQPVYYCIGNHDHEPMKETTTIDNDAPSEAVYISHYGPKYYSFNRGKVHYIVFDNIRFKGGPDDSHDVFITQEQLDWIEGDLKFVPKNHALVLMSHSPTQTRKAGPSSYGNSTALHKLLKGYVNVQILTGHTHYNTVVQGDGMMEHVLGTICGGFWEGPVCLDGALIGYKVFEVDGTDIKWEYAAIGERRNTQFSVFKNSAIPGPLKRGSELLINVWDWDQAWTVQYSEDNGATFRNMTQTEFKDTKAYDPTAYTHFGTTNTDGLPTGRQWIKAGTTDHLFYCTPGNGVTQIVVKVRSRFGSEYTETITL